MRSAAGITSAEIYWTTDTAAGFNALTMTDIGGNNWSADIPAQSVGTTIFYYIHATATSGKQQVRPIVAPDGWWKFRVLDINASVDDGAAPSITEVFPNPSASLIMVTLNVPRGPVHVYLADATGRTVMELHNGSLPHDNRVFADIEGLKSGAYLVVAESATGRSVQRVVRK
ncbi:MAG: T9SS type A sorting domain-containing protein [Flavobacteriales bacterium]|nr:T9SS type A sorting domain-containing protein [Flavobacteriales bacterium]